MPISRTLAHCSAAIALFASMALISVPPAVAGTQVAKAPWGGGSPLAQVRVPRSRFRFGLSQHNHAVGDKNRANRLRAASRSAAVPSTPPSSDLLFNATHLSDFWLVQAAPGAVSEVPDPAGGGETVFKLTVGDGDMLNISPNPRAEMISPSNITSGDEFWWSTKFFLPADFPASIPGWMNLMQGPYGPPYNGSPPFHIEVNGNHIQWARNLTYKWDVPWQMPLVRNSWVSVMIHERFAADGFLELWVNGQPITFFGSGTYNPNHVAPTQRLETQTMDSSNNGGTNSVVLQSYRKIGMFPSLTTYAGPLKIGSTRASVGG